jgi:hypothetical protein
MSFLLMSAMWFSPGDFRRLPFAEGFPFFFRSLLRRWIRTRPPSPLLRTSIQQRGWNLSTIKNVDPRSAIASLSNPVHGTSLTGRRRASDPPIPSQFLLHKRVTQRCNRAQRDTIWSRSATLDPLFGRDWMESWRNCLYSFVSLWTGRDLAFH